MMNKHSSIPLEYEGGQKDVGGLGETGYRFLKRN